MCQKALEQKIDSSLFRVSKYAINSGFNSVNCAERLKFAQTCEIEIDDIYFGY